MKNVALSSRDMENKFLKEIGDPGITINGKIIPTNEFKFLMHSVKGTPENLKDERERQESQNVHNWLLHRQNQTYSVTDEKLRKKLDSDKAVRALKENGNLEKNQYLFNELVEYGILDLLNFFYKDEDDIQISKSSLYDDIKSKIDVLIEGKHTKIGIDITLSSNDEILQEKGKYYEVTPLEYNLSLGKDYTENNGSIRINPLEKETIERFVLPVEPNLAQIFLIEYIDLIRTEENPTQIDDSTVEIARQETLRRYEEEEAQNSGTAYEKFIGNQPINQINQLIETTQSKLLDNLH